MRSPRTGGAKSAAMPNEPSTPEICDRPGLLAPARRSWDWRASGVPCTHCRWRSGFAPAHRSTWRRVRSIAIRSLQPAITVSARIRSKRRPPERGSADRSGGTESGNRGSMPSRNVPTPEPSRSSGKHSRLVSRSSKKPGRTSCARRPCSGSSAASKPNSTTMRVMALPRRAFGRLLGSPVSRAWYCADLCRGAALGQPFPPHR